MKHIAGFNGLRALSILLVLLTHLGLYNLLPENYFCKVRIWRIVSGTTGVQIFFCLSGFLITKLLLIEKAKHGRISLILFFKRRFLRLLPPLVIFHLTLILFLKLDWIKFHLFSLVYSLLYCYNFIPKQFYSGEMGHMWSLAVEEQFYIFWPILVAIFSARKNAIISIAIIILCGASLFILPNIDLFNKFFVQRWFIPACAPIMMGSLAAILYSTQNHYLKNVNHPLIWSAFFFLSPLVIPSFAFLLHSIFQSVGVAIFLVWVCENQQSKLVTFLNIPFLSYIGKISYGIYIYQGLFLRTGPGSELHVQTFPLNLILVFIISIISFHLIEKPLLLYKEKFKRV